MFFTSKFFTLKLFKSLIVCGGVAIASLFSLAQPASAIEGDYARFHVCQKLKATNSLKWYGIASGTEDSTYSNFEYSRSFHTKACFSNKRDCRIWLKRIWWEIPTMDELRTAYCKRI